MKQTFRKPLPASIGLALRGIGQVTRRERNMKIHLLAAFLAVTLGLLLGISRIEWLMIILIIFMVFSAETFNSAIEEICNLLKDKLGLN